MNTKVLYVHQIYVLSPKYSGLLFFFSPPVAGLTNGRPVRDSNPGATTWHHSPRLPTGRGDVMVMGLRHGLVEHGRPGLVSRSNGCL